ncbi:hypothetical protein OAG24_00145 [bacterium]|nr:hypothetical protein [bacterium]
MNPQNFTKVEAKYIQAHKISGDAVIPRKAEGHENDVGFDITLIGRTENRAEDELGKVNKFHTGLELKPPKGFYLELIAKSSLHDQGYMLATGTTIIEPSNTGEIIVPLYKYSDESDLDLPFDAVQLILRQHIEAHVAEDYGLDQSPGFNQQYGVRSDPNQIGYNPQQGEQFMNRPGSLQTARHTPGQRRPVSVQPQNQFY